MSNWSGMTITSIGKQVQARCLELNKPLKFSKLAFGDGELEGGQTKEALRDLVNWKQDIGISSVKADGERVTIRTLITNLGILIGYMARELGLFVTDPDGGENVLFAYFYDSNPDYMPPEGVRTIDETFKITLLVSDALEVSAKINLDNVATIQDVEDAKVKFSDIYPVGAVYISTVATNPGELFSGTVWKAMPAGRMLLAQGAGYPVGSIGGEKEHKLTIDETPAHKHNVTIDASGNHYHGTWGEAPSLGSGPFGFYDANGNHAGTNGGIDYDNALYRTSTNGQHNHNANVSNSGGNKAHNNMPPYIVVHMWQRVE